MAAFYNEIDPYAAQWLRNLIAAGHIAPGVVDERDIRDIRPDELAGYSQCHFFAGIGGWSLAARLAGWPDTRPVWTGSCPCQPFSAAGARAGFNDERHLWPAFHWLISQCRPSVVFGEQVASKDGLGWFDLVQADLEGEDYAVGVADLCAAGVGAPHIRQRLYWVADSTGQGPLSGAQPGICGGEEGRRSRHGEPERSDAAFSLADTSSEQHHGAGNGGAGRRAEYSNGRATGVVEHPDGVGRERRQEAAPGHQHDRAAPERSENQHGPVVASASGLPEHGTGPTNGFWANADWLYCRDDKWRPVESGTFPLAHGIPGRVGRLRAYGNAIVPQVAAEFIGAYLDAERARLMSSLPHDSGVLD